MFQTIEDISNYLLKHPSKTYALRNTNTIDRIVVHQTIQAIMESLVLIV